MDWTLCVICGEGGDLKCPADSNHKNGLEIYRIFLAVKEFENIVPMDVNFGGEDMKNYLTFLQTEYLHMIVQATKRFTSLQVNSAKIITSCIII